MRPHDRFRRAAAGIAGGAAEAMGDGLASGRITARELFDQRHRTVPGTDPEPVAAPFTELPERVLPPILEPALACDSRAAFCAAVDVNGRLPVRDRAVSRPQGRDPAWNAGHCRNRLACAFRSVAGASARNPRGRPLAQRRRPL